MPSLSVNSTILDSIMNELRMPVSNLTERTKIQRVVSGVYADICAKTDWWWLTKRAILNTSPAITAGTVNLSENVAGATFSIAPALFSSNVSVYNYVLLVSGATQDPQAAYQILTHTSGSLSATLDGPFTGTTGVYSYRLHLTGLTLPSDVAKLLHVRRYGQREALQRMGIEDLSYLLQSSWGQGRPQAYSIYDFYGENDPSTQRRLQIYPYSDKAYRLEIHYKHQHASDTSTDLSLPLDYQQTLIYGGLARGYPIFLNDLERGSYYQSLFNDVMALMTKQQLEYAADKPGIGTDMRAYRNGSIRGRSGRGSLGNLFDTLPSYP